MGGIKKPGNPMESGLRRAESTISPCKLQFRSRLFRLSIMSNNDVKTVTTGTMPITKQLRDTASGGNNASIIEKILDSFYQLLDLIRGQLTSILTNDPITWGMIQKSHEQVYIEK